MTVQLVCDACHMKIPSPVHALAHVIVHGSGHEAVERDLDENGVSR